MSLYHEIAEGTYYFPANEVINGGMARLQVNVYAIKGSEKTMIVDTSIPQRAGETIKAISQVIDPESIDYIFLTHVDVDHTGAMKDLLKLAPKARLIGSPTTMGKGMLYGVPMERFALIAPGEEINLGNHSVTVEPSIIEDGHTSWLLDNKTHTYFSSDAFGALHFGEVTDFAENVPVEAFGAGFTVWHGMNFHVLPLLDVNRFRLGVDRLRKLEIQQLASAHGPVIRQDIYQALELMERMPSAELPPPPPVPPFLRLS